MTRGGETVTLFAVGCMCEGPQWEIRTDHPCHEDNGGEPCPHCHSLRKVTGVHILSGQAFAKARLDLSTCGGGPQ